jgi:hypothetical protein
MPINTDLNIAPYFDDFDIEKQFYKILFKPAYAVQARELTQLQTILQNQLEQFGDNVYKEGSIIKGCNFTELNSLQFVKLVDKTGFDIENYIGGESTLTEGGVVKQISIRYEIESATGLKASIVSAIRGFETRPPNLNTFFINYLNTETAGRSIFSAGESLTINKYIYEGSTLRTDLTELTVAEINVTLLSPHVGSSFGIQSTPGVIFQKGHFLFTDDQTLIVSKYTNQPDETSVGFSVNEELISSLQDSTLYDNANGSTNENAPGADRLKMVPQLVAKLTAEADVDSNFFTLIRYQDGNAVTLRDVTQFNSINEAMAKRTYEESGNYISKDFKIDLDRRDNELKALIGRGTAYIKGYRVENAGKVGFTIDNVSATANQPNQAVGVNYGSYVTVTDVSGTIDLDYSAVNLQNAGGNNIGTAIARNLTENRLYLFNVKMTAPNVFEGVTRVIGAGGIIGIAAGSRVKEFRASPLIFDSGSAFTRTVGDEIIPVRAYNNNAGVSANQVTVASGVDADFACDQNDLLFVDSTNTKIGITGFSKANGDTEMTVDLDPADSSASSGTLYYNKRLKNLLSAPHDKLYKEVYVKVNYNPSIAQYSLGFPDAHAILDIYDASMTRYTDSFSLETNQKDHFYDISYMEHIPGRPAPALGQITIKLAVFQVSTGTGSYYFSINSYPIDDTATPAAGTIRSHQLQTYRAQAGNVFNLRNAFDFRPHVDKDPAVDYTDTSASSAGVVTASVGTAPVFTPSAKGYLVPALDSSINADIEFYLARIDALTIDSYGVSSLVKGTESEKPVTPVVGPDVLIVGEIQVPGYPVISSKEASESGRFDCAVRIVQKGTKNYTMRDIEKIERRIDGLEYYISLNQLEQDTQNLTVLDENGLTRFKNGYIVDPMNNSAIANTEDPNYSAAIHFDKKIMTPSVNTFPIDLKYKSSTGASIYPNVNDAEIASLSRDSNVKLLGQSDATNFRNCVSNFWKYNGAAALSPSHDMAHDTVQNPTPVEIDIASVFQDMQEFMPITGVNWTGQVTETLASSTTTGGGGGLFGFFRGAATRTDTFTRTETGIQTALSVNDGGVNAVGDFVTNVQFNPFMRSRNVKVFISGLRPNTQHYFFFDAVDVNVHVRPGSAAAGARDIGNAGAYGAAVKTDANGVLRAIFRIPEGTFYVGDRTLKVSDSSQYSSIESAGTSFAEITYHAYNMTQEKSTLSTRVPEFGLEDVGTTTRNLPSRVVSTRVDPLAQTFFIKQGMGKGSKTVFISKVDLFFKRKSDINGVTITLREVLNGYPTGSILPFSKTHLTPAQVSVSDDGSAVTEVEFESPVRMDVEKEYAVVIMPDANDPNYLHFTAKVGGTNLISGQPVNMDWGDGVLFTSTNNRAWKSYQDEDIKFTIYRHNFSAATGTVVLTDDDQEFLTLSNWDGRFNPGEYLYKQMSAGYVVNIVQNTSVITTTGNDFSADYSAGDFIHVTNSANDTTEIFRIASVDSATQMTTTQPCYFNGSNATGKPVVAGKINHYNTRTANVVHLKQSSATISKKFVAGDTVYGLTSGTEGTIGSVNDVNISYVQPLIQKSNDSTTTTSITGTFSDPSNVADNYTLPMAFGNNNEFTRKGVICYSKSNNFINTKPFEINVAMTNASNVTSTPLIDIELSTLLAYSYKTTNTPATASKYISKTIELAQDLDAEDLNLFLTGYRPNGSNIKVYIRPQHAQDSAQFNTLPWIELELFEGTNTFSSSINTNDYKEFRYRVPETAKDTNGIIKYTGSAGTFSSYRKFAIKIELLSENVFNVPFVRDYRGIALT